MSSGWKFGRVVHVFGVQLRDIIHLEQSHFCFFLTVVHFYFRFQSLLFRGVSFEVSNVFMAVISDEHR
jgi:hypothetical protein